MLTSIVVSGILCLTVSFFLLQCIRVSIASLSHFEVVHVVSHFKQSWLQKNASLTASQSVILRQFLGVVDAANTK